MTSEGRQPCDRETFQIAVARISVHIFREIDQEPLAQLLDVVIIIIEYLVADNIKAGTGYTLMRICMIVQTVDLIRLDKDRIGQASEMLTRAFFNDPKLTYILTEERGRNELGRHLFTFELNYGLNYGRVYATSPALEGVAVWLPSAKSAITLWRAMRSGGMALQKNLGKETMKRLMNFSDQVDAYHARHAPDPHCYLFFIGVDPGSQGKGFGGKLIRPILERLDQRGIDCYLNTQNEKNIGLYEHFGFTMVEQVTLPGTEILHTGMIRKAGATEVDTQGRTGA
jgi:ribosomal protein S18 acetylase RimI-like enzyme